MLKFKKMGSEKIPLLLITANVGSIFESPTIMLPLWINEFLQTISKMEPKFIGLHMQEVGGKTYEKSMQYVQNFIQTLRDSPELRLFDKIRVYLDEDYSSAEKFTALGNAYFIHSSLMEVKIWDFLSQEWVVVEGKEVFTGSIEKVTTKEKAKFPQHFFPECKWSRKGFMRVRWLIRNTAFELINVHLFHDASNMIAMEATPSVYSRSRRRALQHTLQHLHQDPQQPPFFIFGDFNFRLDTAGVVKKISENLKTNRIHNGKSIDHTKLQYRHEKDDKVILTIAKKEFTHIDHQKIFREPWVLKFDKELDALKPHLYEFPIKFPPTYPFDENIDYPTHYMRTRCPAWCDRILLSQTARMIINHLDGQKLMPKDHTESRRSIVEQMDGVLKHGSRRSIAESTDSGGGSPSRSSHRSSGQSSLESSPARSASPNTYSSSNMCSISIRKPSSEFEGLSVPIITQSRKSIADPTNIIHALNARAIDVAEGSPTKKRLVRNQSEGSPKMSEHLDLRKLSTDSGNLSLRKRVEYGVIGETVCMGDHKPVYLRILLQSDKGTVRCCMQDDPNKYCFILPQEISSETCFRHPSAHNLFKCPSRECFEPINITAYRSRLASQISYDSGFRGLSPNDKPPSLLRLGTDPSLVQIKNSINKTNSINLSSIKLCDKSDFVEDNVKSSNTNINKLTNFVIPDVQINIVNSDYTDYDRIIVNNIDTHLLYCKNVPIAPYTPESIESHSPCINDETDKQSFSDIIINDSNVLYSIDINPDLKIKHVLDDNSFFNKSHVNNKGKSVSPRQLKSRLENILRNPKCNTNTLNNSTDLESNDKNKYQKVKMNSRFIKSNEKVKTQNRCKCFGCYVC